MTNIGMPNSSRQTVEEKQKEEERQANPPAAVIGSGGAENTAGESNDPRVSTPRQATGGPSVAPQEGDQGKKPTRK